MRRAVRLLFAVLPAVYLIRRHIMPSEIPDGQGGEHRRVSAGGEQEGHKVQLHLRVVGPHPDTTQRDLLMKVK